MHCINRIVNGLVVQTKTVTDWIGSDATESDTDPDNLFEVLCVRVVQLALHVSAVRAASCAQSILKSSAAVIKKDEQPERST